MPELESAHQVAEQRAVLAEDQLTRLRVTRAAGLDDTFADRLRGKGETELAADAAALAELLTEAAGKTAAPASAPASAPTAPQAPGRLPVEALRPASASPPAEAPEGDPAAIAALIFGKPHP